MRVARPFRAAFVLLALLAATRLQAAELTADAPPVGPFHALAIAGVLDVTLVQDGQERVSVEAAPTAQARIRLNNVGGRLVIDAEPIESRGFSFGLGRSTARPRLTIHFRNLDSIELSAVVRLDAQALKGERLRITASGASHLRIDALDVDRLAIDASGAFKADLAGRATEQKLELSGAGDYRAAQLACDTADVQVSGAGRVQLQVEKALNVRASGAASVEYVGNPKVVEHVTGVGRVRRRDS